jgi:hypothetical protein
LGVLEDHGAVFVAEGAADLAGDSGYEGVGRDDGLFGDDGACGDDGAFADAGVVEDGGSDTDEDGVFEDAAVDCGVVTYGYHFPDDDRVEVAHSVQHCTILHIAFRSDANRIHISANNCVHPHAGVLAENDIADDLRGGIDVAACWNDGSYSLIRADHKKDFTLWRQTCGIRIDEVTKWVPNYQGFMRYGYESRYS